MRVSKGESYTMQHGAFRLLCIWFFLLLVSSALAKNVTFDGKGYDSKGKLIFTEKYALEEEDNKILKIETKYFDPKGNLIAEMTSNFDKKPFLPDLFYKKYIIDYEYGIKVMAAKAEAYKIQKDEKKKSKFFKFENNLVSGHGFYAFILDQLDSLIAGGKTQIHYLQPFRLTTFPFHVEAKEDKKDPDIVHVRLKIQKAHLKPFVPDIQLDIQRSTRRVISYKGAYEGYSGGIGKPKIVRIEFSDYKES